MKKYRKIIAIALLGGMGLSAYAASTMGLGMRPLKNQQTMATIKKIALITIKTRMEPAWEGLSAAIS